MLNELNAVICFCDIVGSQITLNLVPAGARLNSSSTNRPRKTRATYVIVGEVRCLYRLLVCIDDEAEQLDFGLAADTNLVRIAPALAGIFRGAPHKRGALAQSRSDRRLVLADINMIATTPVSK